MIAAATFAVALVVFHNNNYLIWAADLKDNISFTRYDWAW